MKRDTVSISTPYIQLNSLLKLCGEASTGGQAGDMIRQRLVRVDGDVCSVIRKKLCPGAVVSVEDREYEVVAGGG